MTLSYRTVQDADLTSLSEAVVKWRNLPGQFDSIAESFRAQVSGGLRGSDWSGEAADAAFGKFDTVEKQFKAASDEAKDIHRLLDSALEAFRSVQKRLKDVGTAVSEDRYLKLSPEGNVHLDVPPEYQDQAATLQKSYLETVQAYNDRIERALSDATDADDALAWALAQDANGRARGFDPDTVHSIKDAEHARTQASADVDTAMKLANLGDKLKPEQITRLNNLLSRHEGDPYFTESFATRMGAKGTLNLWQRLADRTQYGDARTKALRKLQKTLGCTLATASHSHSDAMQNWKNDMLKLGDQRLDITNPNTNTQEKGPYGFQVMSALMRNGKYDTGFLDDYGKELITFEKSQKPATPGALWHPDDYQALLNLGGTDQGKDPMTGYMEALGHNPQAAQDLFYSEDWYESKNDDHLDPDLKYLLNDRQWPGGQGHGELSHALQSATLGVPYDRPELGLHRTDTTANIMEQAVLVVDNGGPAFLDDRPGLATGLAKMGAGYMDDLNWSVAQFGETSTNSKLLGDAFHHSGMGHIDLDHRFASQFLVAVGRDDHGYQILSAAQQDYTMGAIKAHLNPNPEVAQILQSGAKTHGLLDQARLSEVHETYGEKTEAAEKKLAESSEWRKFGISQGIGLGVGLATLPFGGPATSAAVAFAVPTIIEAAGGAMETNFGLDVDRQADAQAADFSNKEQLSKEEFLKSGQHQAANPAAAYIRACHRDNTQWSADLMGEVEGAYNAGDNEANQVDTD